MGWPGAPDSSTLPMLEGPSRSPRPAGPTLHPLGRGTVPRVEGRLWRFPHNHACLPALGLWAGETQLNGARRDKQPEVSFSEEAVNEVEGRPSQSFAESRV